MSEDEYEIIFSKNLKHYLEEAGKTQTDLINDLNLSSSTVSNWCTAQKMPRMNKVQMLADYLGIEKSDLIENKIEKNDITYNDMIKIYTRGKNNLTSEEKIKLAQIILADRNGEDGL
jgi:repressor LexA